MKKYRYYIAMITLLLISINSYAYGYGVREEARFLTDKMSYELGLNSRQYIDVYEINYDFIAASEQLKHEIIRGNSSAMNSYYRLLDFRNEDLYWVLNTRQYRNFTSRNYFYRPIQVSSGGWSLRVFLTYTNRSHYYYAPPTNYRSYRGRYHRNNGLNYYYRDRYTHSRGSRYKSVQSNSRRYNNMRREDFGYRRDNVNNRNKKNSQQRSYQERYNQSSTRYVNNRNNTSSRNVDTKNPNRTNQQTVSSRRDNNTQSTRNRTVRTNQKNNSRRSTDSSRGRQESTSRSVRNTENKSTVRKVQQNNGSQTRSNRTNAVRRAA